MSFSVNIYIGLVLSALTGVLLAMSGIYNGIFAWIAFVPVCIAFEGAHLKRSLIYGAVGGVFAGALLFYGVILYGIQYYIVLIAYHALQGALAGATYTELLKKVKNPLLNIFIPPLAWIFFEYLKTLGQISFPMPLGSSQYNFKPLLQFSSIAGVYGISLIILWANRIISIWIVQLLGHGGLRGIRQMQPVLSATAMASALLIIIIGWGNYILMKNPVDAAGGIRTTVLQGNVPIQFYWRQTIEDKIRNLISNRYFNMTDKAFSHQRPHIVVWPEGAICQKVMVIDDYRAKIIHYARKYNAFIIIGAPGNDEKGYATNSAYVVSNKGEVVGRYDKVKVVPFLENYKEGRGYFPISTKLGTLGIAICFESAYPQIMRALTRNGAEILFVLTNDCGFGNSPLASMHAKDTILRAVENRRFVVRADQSGISLIVDPFGRVLRRYSGQAYEMISAAVSAEHDVTRYTNSGDLLPLIAFLTCITIIIRKDN